MKKLILVALASLMAACSSNPVVNAAAHFAFDAAQDCATGGCHEKSTPEEILARYEEVHGSDR